MSQGVDVKRHEGWRVPGFSGGPGARWHRLPALGMRSEIGWPAWPGLPDVRPGVRCEKKSEFALSRRGALPASARHFHTECASPIRSGHSHSQGAWPGDFGIRIRLPAAFAWLVGTQDGVPRLRDGPFCTCGWWVLRLLRLCEEQPPAGPSSSRVGPNWAPMVSTLHRAGSWLRQTSTWAPWATSHGVTGQGDFRSHRPRRVATCHSGLLCLWSLGPFEARLSCPEPGAAWGLRAGSTSLQILACGQPGLSPRTESSADTSSSSLPSCRLVPSVVNAASRPGLSPGPLPSSRSPPVPSLEAGGPLSHLLASYD